MHLVRRKVATASINSRTAYQLAFGLRVSTVKSFFSARDGRGYTNSFHRKIGSNVGDPVVVHGERGETCVVSAALAFLEGKKRVVEELRPEDYAKVDKSIGASVGGHVRHSLDHFAKCLAILNDNSNQAESGGTEQDKETSTSIRYDHRERGGTVETDPAGAVEVISYLLEQLRALPRGRAGSEKLRGILVTPAFFLGSAGASADDDGDQEHRFLSNLERELFFCCHHGMHHDAMIRLILKGMAERESGAARALLEGGKGLGMAPSTVNFREKQQQQQPGLDD